jgi:hypothetical protein
MILFINNLECTIYKFNNNIKNDILKQKNNNSVLFYQFHHRYTISIFTRLKPTTLY